MSLAWLLAQFALCALLIAGAGYVLSHSGDRLAALHGWGRGWVGLALLASVTSLPELSSGLSAVALFDAPNLAMGNALGACVVNLGFLVIVDAVQRRQPMYREAGAVHLLSAAFGVVMLGFVALSLQIGARAPSLFQVGAFSPLLFGLYLLALRSVQAHSAQGEDPPATGAVDAGPDARRREWRRFGIAAVVVVGAGLWLPGVADRVAGELQLSRSFVGTIFMALVTTLPEMAVTLSALRLGALDMAIGNLLGSSLFNVMILAIDDLFYRHGPLLAAADPVHAGTAVTAMVMSGLVIIGLLMRPQGRVLRVSSWISVGLVAAYLVNATLVYLAAA